MINQSIQPPLILVTDDNKDTTGFLARVLEKEGYRVIQANDADQAYDAIETEIPDLILLDVILPDMTGFELCHQFKGRADMSRTLIMLMSGWLTDTESKVQGIDVGADEFLSKPIRIPELKAKLRALLRLKHAQDELAGKAQEYSARSEQLNHLTRELQDRVAVRTEQLDESEALYRSLMDAHIDGIALVIEGQLVQCNNAWKQMFWNDSLPKLEGALASRCFSPRFRGQVERFLVMAEQGGLVEPLKMMGCSNVHPGMALELRCRLIQHGGRPGLLVLARDVSQAAMHEELVNALPRRILAAQEEERRRVARELHDGVNQLLASVRFRARSIAERQEGRLEGQEDWIRIQELLEEAQDEVRRISRALRPSELDDLGFMDAVRSNCNEFTLRTGVPIELTEQMDLAFQDKVVETHLYRILQEGLFNVEKHAESSRVRVSVSSNLQHVHLRIEDNGKGFAIEGMKRNPGLGLQHLRERASLAGGLLEVQSEIGQGTTLQVSIPYGRKTEGALGY